MPVVFYDDQGDIMGMTDSFVLQGKNDAGTPMFLIDKSLLDQEMVKKYRCQVVSVETATEIMKNPREWSIDLDGPRPHI